MTSFSPDRHRRVAAAALVVTAIAAAVLIMILGLRVPKVWWPHTGHAFATGTHAPHEDPCGLIVPPAKKYCERHATRSDSAVDDGGATGAWRVLPPAAGLVALLIWWRRDTAGQRRR
jgi:hypothetical protein